MKIIPTRLLLTFLCGLACVTPIGAQNTAFTYQGRLNDNGNPANGTYDLRFAIHDLDADGSLVAGPLTNNAVAVSNGLFTVTLDFDGGVFTGNDRWLEISVRSHGNGAFDRLDPRQPILPTPYAMHSATAQAFDGVLQQDQLIGTYANPVVFSNAANVFVGDGSGLANVNVATLNGLDSTAFWKIEGNSGTTPGTHFLGTTDNQALEFRVNNSRVLRLVPGNVGPNIIAGFKGNVVSNGVSSGTIAGGGEAFAENRVGANSATVAGGNANTASGAGAAVGGGIGNLANGLTATLGGGNGNSASADFATVGGGRSNMATNQYATVGGGQRNSASGIYATIGGGLDNIANGQYAMVCGGHSNVASGDFSFAAGNGAKALHQGAFVWADDFGGGFSSTTNDQFSVRARSGVRIANPGDGHTLLRLESDRPWEFRQLGTGAGTALELVSLDASGVANKNFVINTTGGGSVGIGTTTPSFKLHVNGSVAGVGAYNSLSDRRFKKDIQPLTNALDQVMQLEGVSFDWRREEHPEMEFDKGRQIGFVAQDLQRVVPEAVSTSPDGTLHAAYSEIIPILVEAIKEQRRQAWAAEEALHQKEATITRLAQRLERIEQLLNEKSNGNAQ